MVSKINIEKRSVVVTRSNLRTTIILMSLTMIVLAAFFLGDWRKAAEFERVSAENLNLSESLLEAKNSLEALKEEIDILKMNNQVDSLALEDSRQDILELEQRISENVFQLELYKDFLSDDLEANQKLSVVKFAKSRVSNKNWSYSWVIVQRGREPRVSSVLIRAFVEGKTDVNSDDGLKEFPLNQLDEYLPRFPIQTRIKYFSINRGVLSLPEGFEPIKIKFVLSYESSPKQIYESTFDWRGDL